MRAQNSTFFNFVTYLLAEAQNLEALEVGEVLAAVGALGALSERALGPLAIDLVLGPELLDGASTGSTGKLGDGEVGEGGVREGEDVTGNDLVLLGGGTVNEDLLRRSQVNTQIRDVHFQNLQFYDSRFRRRGFHVHGGGPRSRR